MSSIPLSDPSYPSIWRPLPFSSRHRLSPTTSLNRHATALFPLSFRADLVRLRRRRAQMTDWTLFGRAVSVVRRLSTPVVSSTSTRTFTSVSLPLFLLPTASRRLLTLAQSLGIVSVGPKMVLHYGGSFPSFSFPSYSFLELTRFSSPADLTDTTNLVSIIATVQPSEVYNLAAQSHVKVSFDMAEYTVRLFSSFRPSQELTTVRTILTNCLNCENRVMSTLSVPFVFSTLSALAALPTTSASTRFVFFPFVQFPHHRTD